MDANWENTKSKLSNPKHAFSLTDERTKVIVERNITGEIIANDYNGSFQSFTDFVREKGIGKATIQNRFYNGTVNGKPQYRNHGDEYSIDFTATTDVANTFAAAHNNSTLPALASPALNGGLNATIFRDMHYPLIAAELETAKSDVKRLTEENRKLETKILVNETLDGKSTGQTLANAKLLETLSPLASAMVEKFLTPAPAVTPAGLSGASVAKMQYIQSIMQCDDATVHLLSKLSERIEEDAVWESFENLLKTHSIAS